MNTLLRTLHGSFRRLHKPRIRGCAGGSLGCFVGLSRYGVCLTLGRMTGKLGDRTA